MNNTMIVANEAVLNNIFTQEQIMALWEKGMEIPLFTFQKWKALGYSVKKGEHAAITTNLWKWRDKKRKEKEESDGQIALDLIDPEEEKENGHFYLHKVHLFNYTQVEKIEKAENAA